MYTYKKCYVGFCTPRCMVMDSKKKKNCSTLMGPPTKQETSSSILILEPKQEPRQRCYDTSYLT